ncbi:MAG TPA: glucose-6-phosphate isomerase [Bacteroidales bacterium]|nr:glucose-6-phosphate isomerase [Bacteroidales bacterium]
MSTLNLSIDKIFDFVSKDKVYAFADECVKQNKALHEKTGKGNDFLGWVNLPSSITPEIIKDIEKTAASFRKNCEVVVVVGIGGSYLGAKSVIEALSDSFYQINRPKDTPLVVFAGQNIGEDYTAELIKLLDKKKYGIICISKSGTTTEPAIAFRILKGHLEQKVGKPHAKELIVAITDAKRGALRTLATQEGYKTYVIPDDVGGRFSVLTPVGLLPIAVAGFDIAKLVAGAQKMEELTAPDVAFEDNPAAIYAAARNALYKAGKKIEILANYNHKLTFVAEWWKQLYGESEGKENKGIFPASVTFTSDLHSMGQYIQEGERHIFETVITVKNTNHNVAVPFEKDNLDGLNFLAYKRIDEVNKMAELGTLVAHMDGGVPNIIIEISRLDEYNLGLLFYFFEKACGISGYLLKVNPFDQPGVEAYKKNMFALLDKPGFETDSEILKKRLGINK